METAIRIRAFGRTDSGRKRTTNEDTFLVNTKLGYYLIADGIGGAAAGELASSYFAKTVADIFASVPENSLSTRRNLVEKSFLEANSRIRAHIAATPSHSGMGCTAELFTVVSSSFILGHIGDSRTYRLRQGHLSQLTSDHSLVQQQLDQGIITAEQAKTHQLRNVILRAVGTSEQIAVDIVQGQIIAGDLFLLCSDGLSDMIDENQLHEILRKETSIEKKTDMLVNSANTAGGRDNITVVVIEVR